MTEYHVAAVDLGIKSMTPHRMAERGMTVHVLPGDVSPEEMLARGLELGESRIIAGMHSPLDVISGRMLGQASAVVTIPARAIQTLVQ